MSSESSALDGHSPTVTPWLRGGLGYTSLVIPVDKCVICDGQIHLLRRALVAPFLAKRIWNRDAFPIDLDTCSKCGFAFYNPRPSDAELHREYSGYRSPEYLALRNSYEPWYTARMNADLSSDEEYRVRRTRLSETLKTHIPGRKIHRILDHGGDHGDLVAGLIDGAQAFLYDISGAAPAAGVKAISDPSSCSADLTINSNVLEHVGFPRVTAEAVFKSTPIGSLVFLEVPCEIPTGTYRLSRRFAQIGLVAVLRPTKVKALLTPRAFYLMHEHINYFTLEALLILTRKSGGRIIASGTYPFSNAAGSAEVAWSLSERER